MMNVACGASSFLLFGLATACNAGLVYTFATRDPKQVKSAQAIPVPGDTLPATQEPVSENENANAQPPPSDDTKLPDPTNATCVTKSGASAAMQATRSVVEAVNVKNTHAGLPIGGRRYKPSSKTRSYARMKKRIAKTAPASDINNKAHDAQPSTSSPLDLSNEAAVFTDSTTSQSNGAENSEVVTTSMSAGLSEAQTGVGCYSSPSPAFHFSRDLISAPDPTESSKIAKDAKSDKHAKLSNIDREPELTSEPDDLNVLIARMSPQKRTSSTSDGLRKTSRGVSGAYFKGIVKDLPSRHDGSDSGYDSASEDAEGDDLGSCEDRMLSEKLHSHPEKDDDAATAAKSDLFHHQVGTQIADVDDFAQKTITATDNSGQDTATNSAVGDDDNVANGGDSIPQHDSAGMDVELDAPSSEATSQDSQYAPDAPTAITGDKMEDDKVTDDATNEEEMIHDARAPDHLSITEATEDDEMCDGGEASDEDMLPFEDVPGIHLGPADPILDVPEVAQQTHPKDTNVVMSEGREIEVDDEMDDDEDPLGDLALLEAQSGAGAMEDKQGGDDLLTDHVDVEEAKQDCPSLLAPMHATSNTTAPSTAQPETPTNAEPEPQSTEASQPEGALPRLARSNPGENYKLADEFGPYVSSEAQDVMALYFNASKSDLEQALALCNSSNMSETLPHLTMTVCMILRRLKVIIQYALVLQLGGKGYIWIYDAVDIATAESFQELAAELSDLRKSLAQALQSNVKSESWKSAANDPAMFDLSDAMSQLAYAIKSIQNAIYPNTEQYDAPSDEEDYVLGDEDDYALSDDGDYALNDDEDHALSDDNGELILENPISPAPSSNSTIEVVPAAGFESANDAAQSADADETVAVPKRPLPEPKSLLSKRSRDQEDDNPEFLNEDGTAGQSYPVAIPSTASKRSRATDAKTTDGEQLPSFKAEATAAVSAARKNHVADRRFPNATYQPLRAIDMNPAQAKKIIRSWFHENFKFILGMDEQPAKDTELEQRIHYLHSPEVERNIKYMFHRYDQIRIHLISNSHLWDSERGDRGLLKAIDGAIDRDYEKLYVWEQEYASQAVNGQDIREAFQACGDVADVLARKVLRRG